MKSAILVMIGLFMVNLAHAADLTSGARQLKSIEKRVHECSVLPYTMEAGRKSYHEIYSQCDDVKVVAKGVATVEIDGHAYVAAISETEDSDADIYNVEIKDLTTGKFLHIDHVFAYGDVMLGLLGGNTTDVQELLIDGN